MTIKEFNKMFHAWKTEHSNMPEHTVPRTNYKDTSEKELKRAISAFCKMRGYGFLTYDARGRKLPNGKFAFSHMNKGAPDCIVTIPLIDQHASIVVHVEIKMPGDRQRDVQRRFQLNAESRCERYIMPKNWDTFFAAINHIAP